MTKETKYEVYYYLVDRESNHPIARYKTLEELDAALHSIEGWRLDFYRTYVADNKSALTFALKVITSLDIYKMSQDDKHQYKSGQYNHVLGFSNMDYATNPMTRDEKRKIKAIFKQFELALVSLYYDKD